MKFLKRTPVDLVPMHTTHNLPGVMLYEGKSYAVGLLWFTVQEGDSKGLLQRRIKKTKADFTCQRLHIAMQQGFGWLAKGHRRGMPAAAAMIADQLVGEWHGVFEADNGWWYVQVRSDTITPNGDRFFTSEEDAYHLFQQEMQENVWPHAYAPQKWAIQESNIRELSLRNMLDDLTTTTLSSTNITAFFGGTTQRNIVLGGLAAIFSIMAMLAAYSLLVEEDITPKQSSGAPIRTVQPTIIEAPKADLIEAVSPQQLLQQCGEAAADLYAALPGWKSQDFACSTGKASLSWQQAGGLLNDAKRYAQGIWPANTSVSYNNRLLTARLTLGNLPKVQREVLPTQEMVLMYLEQNLQPMGALQVKPVIPKPPPAPPPRPAWSNQPVPLPPPPLPSYMDIQLMSGFGPDRISPLLSGPGLELVQVQWKIPQAMWQYQLKWTYDNVARAQQPAANPAPAAQAVGSGGQAIQPVTVNTSPSGGMRK